MDFLRILKNNGSISYIKSNPSLSFAHSILFHYYPHKTRESESKRLSYFKTRLSNYNLNKLQYPVKPEDLSNIEKVLNLRINLFSFREDSTQHFPIYISEMSNTFPEVDLLYSNGTYAFIKNFFRFLNGKNSHKPHTFYCRRCLTGFIDEINRKQHQMSCGYPKQNQLARTIFLLFIF